MPISEPTRVRRLPRRILACGIHPDHLSTLRNSLITMVLGPPPVTLWLRERAAQEAGLSWTKQQYPSD
jgi:hypothetical protein